MANITDIHYGLPSGESLIDLVYAEPNVCYQSKDFEQHLQSFISSAQDTASKSLLIISQFCQRRLAIITKKGPRGRNPPIDELRCLSKGAFNPNVFLESLPDVFSLQAIVQPDLPVPACLIFLANGILATGGLRAEGIFRVPADVEAVNEVSRSTS